jgi:hypothetical protein
VHLVRRFKDWRQRRRGRGTPAQEAAADRAEAATARKEAEADISAQIVGHEKTEDVTDEKKAEKAEGKNASPKKPERTDA